MPIIRVWTEGKYEEVVQESSQYHFIPNGSKFLATQRVLYYHRHVYPPALFVNQEGKKFIVPTWVEVHPATQLCDIRWEPPVKKETKKEIKTFVSSSDASIKYKTTKTTLSTGEAKYSCNCPGKWRAKDGECKHIKALKGI
jgi:hypothetical protein